MGRTIEERLEKLEREVDWLKGKARSQPQRDWGSAVIGSFADDPEFVEIVRLGKDLRQTGRPKDNE